jgi:toxin FitB
VILLDTNVLSELVRPHPDPRVVDWMRSQTQSANLRSLRASIGRPIALPDAMIAATAIAAEADAIATRDKDFTDVGLPVVSPWSA